MQYDRLSQQQLSILLVQAAHVVLLTSHLVIANVSRDQSCYTCQRWSESVGCVTFRRRIIISLHLIFSGCETYGWADANWLTINRVYVITRCPARHWLRRRCSDVIAGATSLVVDESLDHQRSIKAPTTRRQVAAAFPHTNNNNLPAWSNVTVRTTCRALCVMSRYKNTCPILCHWSKKKSCIYIRF